MVQQGRDDKTHCKRPARSQGCTRASKRSATSATPDPNRATNPPQPLQVDGTALHKAATGAKATPHAATNSIAHSKRVTTASQRASASAEEVPSLKTRSVRTRLGGQAILKHVVTETTDDTAETNTTAYGVGTTAADGDGSGFDATKYGGERGGGRGGGE